MGPNNKQTTIFNMAYIIIAYIIIQLKKQYVSRIYR